MVKTYQYLMWCGDEMSLPESTLKRLSKTLATDLATFVLAYVGYLYWNTKGVRVTPECRVHLKAKLSPSCSFFGSSRVYGRAQVGHFTYGISCIIDNAHVGKFCSLAPGCLLGPNDHPLDLLSTHPMTYDAAKYNNGLEPTKIGHDVWIGAYAVILSGVRVPDGCIVAASAVVTEDFEPYTIIGGIPARVIGHRKQERWFVEAVSQTEEVAELRRLAGRLKRQNASWPISSKLKG